MLVAHSILGEGGTFSLSFLCKQGGFYSEAAYSKVLDREKNRLAISYIICF